MSLDEYEDFVYKAGFLDKEDPVAEWEKIKKYQDKLVEYLNDISELEIISENTHITLSVEGRKWINCCGNENFPDGEVFTSPVENSINGYITFSYPALMNGNEFKNVRLDFKDGRIISASCADETMNEKLLSYVDTDEGSRYIGEVAFGTNYGITKFSHNILFDEKIGGTMHMALGAGFPEAGSKNDSAIHWDMINDMTKCGKVIADGKVIYENGKFKI
ncbi:aminopeptidase 2 [Clostridiales bacterium]|nr:aminopeptidase 2 [Clostridiales bacterium]